MAQITPQLLETFTNLQTTIWQGVSNAASEAANQMVTFSAPISMACAPMGLYSEFTESYYLLSFSLGDDDDDEQLLIMTEETYLDYCEFVLARSIEAADEAVDGEMKSAMEGILHGITTTISNLTNETILANNLNLRHQPLSLGVGLTNASEIIRTNVVMEFNELSGTLVWLCTAKTARMATGEVEADAATTPPVFEFASGNANAPAQAQAAQPDASLELLLDIPLEISVELGRMKMPVRDVVELGAGSIVEIDKAAGEPVDVLVNGRLVARGEVVVIEDNFGVRITEILSAADRLQRLNEAA